MNAVMRTSSPRRQLVAGLDYSHIDPQQKRQYSRYTSLHGICGSSSMLAPTADISETIGQMSDSVHTHHRTSEIGVNFG